MTPNAIIEDLQRRVLLLEDREEVRDLIERYAEAADRRDDPEMMRPLFAENVSGKLPASGATKGAPRFSTA